MWRLPAGGRVRPLRDPTDTGGWPVPAGAGAWVDRWQGARARNARLGTADAVVLGLASMLGTGVFAVWAPAAAAAGRWLLLAVVLAGVVAACNATSTADLAAAHPQSGGGYVYGSARLCPGAGRLAGVAFLVGKCASAGAAAAVFGAYVLPSAPLLAALLVVAVATALNIAGVRWTARGAYALVGGTLAVLLVVVAVGLSGRGPVDSATAHAGGGRPRARGRRHRRGAGVLRVRGLRAGGHARRRGPRPPAHDPPCDRAGAGDHARRLPAGRERPARRAGPRAARPADVPARRARGRVGGAGPRCDRPGRGGGGGRVRAAVGAGRDQPHGAGDGQGARPAALPHGRSARAAPRGPPTSSAA